MGGRMPGVHLNEEGRAEAEALAERLAGVHLDVIYSSPMERARETAQPIADRHRLEVRVHPGLNEVDCGEWSGEPIHRLREHPYWIPIQVLPSRVPYPGGENAWDVQVRMVAALEEIRATHPDQTIAVISHADPIRIAVAHYIGLPLDLFRRLSISPASVTILAFDPLPQDPKLSMPRLLCLNDTAHLKPKSKGNGGDRQL